MPFKIDFSPRIRQAFPQLRLGLLSGKALIEPRSAELDAKIEAVCAALQDDGDTTSIKTHPVVAATRAAYKMLGKDPSRYRPSAEALMKRAVQGKGLYQVNNFVDCLNAISMITGFSIGGYDSSSIEGAILVDAGKEEDEYEGIGRGALNISNLPALRDAIGAFGTPTSDSQRTSVQDHTRELLMVFYDFDAPSQNVDHLQAALDLATYMMTDFVKMTDIQHEVHSVSS